MKRRQFLGVGASFALGGTLAAMLAGRGSSDVVVAWTKVALNAVRDVKPGPPMVARSLAILHTAR